MHLFSTNYSASNGMRLKGFSRYVELLDRDLKRFLIINLVTVLGFLPFVAGVILSLLSSSILLLIPACIIGGIFVGPALSCMLDTVFRSLRDVSGKIWKNYTLAWKQNWKQSLLPGILLCLFLGCYSFMLMMFWYSSLLPGWGTVSVLAFSLIFLTMFFTVFWTQLVLFEQTVKQRILNSLLFMIRFFWKTFGCALLQILYWIVLVLFLPWSVFLLPLTGIWFILFTKCFLLYDTMNDAFQIEEQISQAFPEQAAFYEDDEAWLKRKQKERT
jgi:uncharacterized membrane protein YesL